MKLLNCVQTNEKGLLGLLVLNSYIWNHLTVGY